MRIARKPPVRLLPSAEGDTCGIAGSSEPCLLESGPREPVPPAPPPSQKKRARGTVHPGPGADPTDQTGNERHRVSREGRASSPRALAFTILRQVTGEGAYANIALAQGLAACGAQGRDAALVTELVAGTCRLLGTYDRILQAAAGRELGTLQPALLDVLRLGAHQILALRTPTPVAVSATVDLAVERIGRRVGGITNAILRRVAVQDFDGWCAGLAQDSPDAYLSLSTGHPEWIVDVYRLVLGASRPPSSPDPLAGRFPDPSRTGERDATSAGHPSEPDPPSTRVTVPGWSGEPYDEVAAALAADNVAPRTTLAVRPGLASVGELIAEGAEPGRWSPYAAIVSGDPARFTAVREGRAGVQDEGSQLVALALAAVDAPAGPWLDYCAGPGGKAALLAGLAGEHRERVVAHELHPHRAALVRQAVRCYDNVDVVVGDGTRPCFQPGSFARVLVDAPCSGLGALRRRPDARWRKDPADIPALHDLQVRLLAQALTLARPGGVVAYVTCSPHPHETTDVVDAVLGQGGHGHGGSSPRDPVPSPATVIDLAEGTPLPADAVQDGYAQLWPHRHGTDAMFCALLRRA